MDRTWAPLVPTARPGSASFAKSSILSSSSPTTSSSSARPTQHSSLTAASSSTTDTTLDPFSIGRLPSTVVQRILSYVPVADLPHCALAGRPLARFVADDRLWAQKLVALQYKPISGLEVRYSPDLSTIQEAQTRKSTNDSRKSSSSFEKSHTNSNQVSNDDDFGDFETGAGFGNGGVLSPEDESFGGFVSSEPSKSGTQFSSAPVFSYRAESKLPMPSSDRDSAYQTFKRIALVLKPFIQSLLFETTPTSSLVFADARVSSLASQSSLICNITRFISVGVLGSFARRHDASNQHQDREHMGEDGMSKYDEDMWRLRMAVREAADYLEGVLLSAFEGADARRSDAIKAGSRGMDVAKAIERAEGDMREHATWIWELAQATTPASASTLASPFETDSFLSTLDHPGSAAALSFLEKREMMFKKPAHQPEANFSGPGNSKTMLDFTAMDAFMKEVLESLASDGSLIARVFPPQQMVLLAFATRVANEIVGEYVNTVLAKARSLDTHLYLQACAATFAQSIRIAETLLAIKPKSEYITKQRCESVVLQMWEAHLDEYLQEERDWVRNSMVSICRQEGHDPTSRTKGSGKNTKMDAAFLASNNPAQVKRNVLTGFKDVLLMPVTVVPRAAGAVGGAMIRTAGTGLSQLNPLKWQAGPGAAGSRTASGTASATGMGTPIRSSTPVPAPNNGYVDFSKEVLGGPDGQLDDGEESDGGISQEKTHGMNGNEDFNAFSNNNAWSDDIDGWGSEKPAIKPSLPMSSSTRSQMSEKQSSIASIPSKTDANTIVPELPRSTSTATISKDDTTSTSNKINFSRLQLLLSLDTALSLIQVNRESLKRIETFSRYSSSGLQGKRVKEELEEICVSFFQVLGEEHIVPGFTTATDQIKTWNPLEDSFGGGDGEKEVQEGGGSAVKEATEGCGSSQVLPLIQFFELTHIADTISQLCTVYFTQTVTPLIDASDFLNPVVRQKKNFESTLDEFVASGLSVAVDLLMKRAEWILFSNRKVTDYNVSFDTTLDLGEPTKATSDTIEVLQFHCKLLVGATDREILDIFYQEVGLRLFGIITKHLKSLQISQQGGFQLISDLNHITSFIASLKCKEGDILTYYNSLKTLSSYYIVSGKELITLLKNKDNWRPSGGNANGSGGNGGGGGAREENFVFGQEELYEFLKSRSDFKLIEKQVDHEIFGFKVAEDCCIM